MNHVVGQGLKRRKVKTGNPSHGMNCEGYVYTVEPDGESLTSHNNRHVSDDTLNASTNNKDLENNIENDYEKIVAICNVPPEQVPGGVLNFARSYRSYIRHVRVLISDEEETFSSSVKEDGKTPSSGSSYPPLRKNTNYSFMDTAGVKTCCVSSSSSEDQDKDATGRECRSSRLYMVLVLLSTKQAADSFVKNLHGKPFHSFEKNIVACVCHVTKIEGNCCDMDNGSAADGDGRIDNHDNGPYASPLYFSRMTTASVLMGTSFGSQNSLLHHPNQHHHGNKLHVESSHVGSPGRQSNAPCYISSRLPIEVNNCPVCLEPMDVLLNSTSTCCSQQQSDAIFTTVCNHTFHMHCLLQWEDAPCPVCRFDHAGLNETLSECHVCGSTERVYVCLICGVASCSASSKSSGSNSGVGGDGGGVRSSKSSIAAKQTVTSSLDHTILPSGHAKQHYDETLHAYAVDTDTQHVWDFVGQGFVHRLIQNFEDGKIVEVADPTNTTSQERSLVPGLTDAEEEEVMHRKLEECANEYNNLLKSQLEQQRLYFEGILLEIRRDHHEINRNRQIGDSQSSSTLIAALKQDLHQLQQRYHSLEAKSKKIAENISFLKNMNESLEANKEPMQKEIKILQQARISYSEMLKKELPSLEEHVMKLMLKLE